MPFVRKIILKFILIGLFSFCSNLFSQLKKDTLFIKKTKTNKIYIDSSSKYNKVLGKSNLPSEITDKFVPIHKYNDSFYLYAPCDWMHNFTVEISREKIFFNYTELVEYNIVKKVNSSNKSCLKYKLENSFKKGVLEIRRYKKNENIFIIKTKFRGEKPWYSLVVNSKDIGHFKIIVNNCPNEKSAEFEFAKINLQKEF